MNSLHPAVPLYVNLLVAFLSVILFKKPAMHQEFKSFYTYLFSGPVSSRIPVISSVLRQLLSSQSKIGKE